MSTRRLSLILTLALLVAAQAFAAPKTWQDKLDKQLQQALKKGNAPVHIIVQAVPGQEENVKALLRGKGKIDNEHQFIKAFTATVNTSDLEVIASATYVDVVSVDAGVTAEPLSMTMAKPFAPVNAVCTLRSTLGLDDTSLDGSGVGVAIIDSGIVNTPEFTGHIAAFYDFVGNGRRAYDDYGHGTHIAGLVAGNGITSRGLYKGVAPGVRLIGIKVLDGKGAGQTSTVIAAIEFAIANKAALGIDVINLSLGHPIFESATTDPLVRAVDKAVAAGIVVVTSAGNYGVNPGTGVPGYAGITSPGNARTAITVGASDIKDTIARGDDSIAPYSSRGPSWYDAYAKPDIVAPGHKLASATWYQSWLYVNYAGLRVPGFSYPLLRLSGTSMASGVATGAVALAIEAHRAAQPGSAPLSPNAVKAILQFTAIPVGGYDALTQGTGSLNAGGAIKLASTLNFSGAPRSGCLPINLDPFTTIGGLPLAWSEDVIWGDDIIWGDDVIWGDNIVWGNDIVWGDDIIWADDIVWGDDVIWGDDIVWGNDIIWADDIVWGDSLVGMSSGGTTTWGTARDPATTVWGDISASATIGSAVIK